MNKKPDKKPIVEVKGLSIQPERIIEIEKRMISLLSPVENRLLLPLMKQLRQKSLIEILEEYNEYIKFLSEKFQKPLCLLKIKGKDVKIDPLEFYDHINFLAMLFESIVKHQDIPANDANGNSGARFINCRLSRKNGVLNLSVCDDGNTAETFLPEVKENMDKISGNIKVKGKYGKINEFIISIPLNEHKKTPDFSFADIINPVNNRAKSYLKSDLEFNVESGQKPLVIDRDNLALNDVSALINMSGVLKGTFIFSFDSLLADSIARRFVLGSVSDEEVNEYLDDTISEVSNIILGNSIDSFPGISELVSLETPTTIRSGDLTIRLSGAEIWESIIKTNQGFLNIYFLSRQID